MVRRQEGAGGGIRLGEPYEVEVGELETGKGNRGAGRIGGGEREGETVKSREDRRGGGKIRDDDAGVSGEPGGAQNRRARVRFPTGNSVGPGLNSRFGSRVSLGVPNRKGSKEGDVDGGGGAGEGGEVTKRRD